MKEILLKLIKFEVVPLFYVKYLINLFKDTARLWPDGSCFLGLLDGHFFWVTIIKEESSSVSVLDEKNFTRLSVSYDIANYLVYE